MVFYPFLYMARGHTDIPGIFRISLMMTNNSLKAMLTLHNSNVTIRLKLLIIMLTLQMILKCTPFLNYVMYVTKTIQFHL